MSFPLIPAERFNERMAVMREVAEEIALNFSFTNRFTRDLQQRWAPRVDILSVTDSPIRTNNVAENFNRHIQSRFGGAHGQVWTFCGMRIS